MADSSRPQNRFLESRYVVDEMSKETRRHILHLSVPKIFVLALMAGAFITFGALFSILLSAGVETLGLQLLLQGFGFSVGFFMVILSRAVLFTEANVVLPASMLNCSPGELIRGALVFWALAIIGNVVGALLVGLLINYAHIYPELVQDGLVHVIEKKLIYYERGGAGSWFRALVSGIFGNWLVGMAAVFAVMGRTIIGKYIPVFLAVSLFVAANFQHSPANIGYFSLIMPTGEGPGWAIAISWNLLPAAIGNILGGIFLVALPFWYAVRE